MRGSTTGFIRRAENDNDPFPGRVLGYAWHAAVCELRCGFRKSEGAIVRVVDVIAVEAMVVSFTKLAAALRRRAAIQRNLAHAAVADVLNLRAIQRKEPSAALGIALWVVG